MAVISDERLMESLSSVIHVDGDFVEIGVFRGHTFVRLSLMARALGRKAHGLDSFEGMAPPTAQDAGYYESGKLSVGGADNFRKIMDKAGVSPDYYELHPGFIPDCFATFPEGRKIAFGLLDVDQYAPTVPALDWIWARLNYGGVLVLDDYFPGREILATLAINEWLARIPPLNVDITGYSDTQLFLRKTPINALGDRYDPALYRQ